MMDWKTILIIVLVVLFTCAAGAAGFFYLQTKEIVLPSDRIKDNDASSLHDELMVDIRLYFMDAEYKQLVIERRPIEPAVLIPDRVKIALEALLEGPTTHRLISTIPDGTRLESVFWNEADARVYVSFSEQLLTHHPGHTLSEWGTIYAIVNTVCAQSDAIREVQILINGETIQDTNTVWDWSLPFEKDDTFVQYTLKPAD